MTVNNDKVRRLKEIFGDDVDGLEVRRFSDLWTIALDHIMSNEDLVRAYLSASLESIVIADEEVPMEVDENELVFRANWTPWMAEAMREEMNRYMSDTGVHKGNCGCPKCTTKRMEKELGRKLDA
jgi:hypothetical protein